MKSSKIRLAAIAVGFLACLNSGSANAQAALQGDHLSAMAPENLAIKRAKPPFNMTGTWNFLIDPKTGLHQFMPLPKLTPAAEAAMAKRKDFATRGLEYRDDSAACWPLGMPRMMTRFWPMQIVQMPTEILLISMFDNSVRWIYMDGRGHPPDDELVYTYNGHSIGHFEGDTLIVDTVGLTDDHHWIQEGIPTSTKLHIVERINLINEGKTFRDTFILTDPDNWEGEWTNTKFFAREDKTDIEEHRCIYEQVQQLPSFKFNVRK